MLFNLELTSMKSPGKSLLELLSRARWTKTLPVKGYCKRFLIYPTISPVTVTFSFLILIGSFNYEQRVDLVVIS